MSVGGRPAEDSAKSRLVAEVVGFALATPAEQILLERRGTASAAFARQVAMYLCNTAFELPITRVASAFGRDRSTVSYACRNIEDRRDEPQFDTWISGIEGMLRETPARRPQ